MSPSEIRVSLPLPPKACSPNARAHWRTVRNAMGGCRTLARSRTPKPRRAPGWPAAEVRILWVARTRTHPDADNALAACKGLLDGIADALEMDDRTFRYVPLEFAVDRENPRVEIVVRPLADQAAA